MSPSSSLTSGYNVSLPPTPPLKSHQNNQPPPYYSQPSIPYVPPSPNPGAAYNHMNQHQAHLPPRMHLNLVHNNQHLMNNNNNNFNSQASNGYNRPLPPLPPPRNNSSSASSSNKTVLTHTKP